MIPCGRLLPTQWICSCVNSTYETRCIFLDDKQKSDRKQYQAEYYAKNRAKIAERKKNARLSQRDEANVAQKERYAEDAEFKEKRREINAASREKHKEQYATDPEYRKKIDERKAKYKERYATDPEYRNRRLALNAASRERRKQLDQQTDNSDTTEV